MDRLIYNEAAVDDISRCGVPLCLWFAALRGGVGRNTRSERARVLETKRRKIAKAYRRDVEPLDYEEDDQDIEDNATAVSESELLSSPIPGARKISVEMRKSSLSLEDVIAKVDSTPL